MLLNAFSFNMLAQFPSTVNVRECTIMEAHFALMKTADENGEIQSAVGHASTAAVFSTELGLTVPSPRSTIKLSSGDVAIVGQYIGPRLQEGETELPQGASIKWLMVEIG